ncbi:hypothetical protein BraRD5C2_54450 [Bradyrhizobium sp. RD5-C2]|nr:hypothetical protein BraRD5C2_54450 [Bradyrhizobium sp. RD5-C2]
MSKLSIPKLAKASTRVAHIKQLTTGIGDPIGMVGRSTGPPSSTASRIGNAAHRHGKDSRERKKWPSNPDTQGARAASSDC